MSARSTTPPYAEVPDFIADLRAGERGEIARLAFEFLILTAARTSEVLGVEWVEIDEAEALWIVPGRRMKKRREHRVPLSGRALAILKGPGSCPRQWCSSTVARKPVRAPSTAV